MIEKIIQYEGNKIGNSQNQFKMSMAMLKSNHKINESHKSSNKNMKSNNIISNAI